MISRVRQKLRMIRYYSATPRQTPWTRAMDVALVLTFVLALPSAWLCDAIVRRSETALSASGVFVQQPDGTMAAYLSTPRNSPPMIPADRPAGKFYFRVTDERCGWPLTTSVVRRPAVLDLDILSETKERPNAQLAPDDPLRRVITKALANDGWDDLLMMWGTPEEPASVRTTIHWWRWAAAASLWWIMLTFASAIMIQFTRLCWIVIRKQMLERAARRRAENKCVKCGYDLTGLEFNERCPECGEIVW
jgi:hypothetical protein